ncbi:MAG: hypothetical protein H0U60_16210, partial [Blastocatellia bacterium]|nr:hypothetical protein [Blastocatellia bacterium]
MIRDKYTVPGSQNKRTRVKVVASSFHFCGGKGKSGDTTAPDASQSVDDDSEDFSITENDSPMVAEPSPAEAQHE